MRWRALPSSARPRGDGLNFCLERSNDAVYFASPLTGLIMLNLELINAPRPLDSRR